ncbi:MAG: amidohydrolase family protein [Opitutaceae bacterium]
MIPIDRREFLKTTLLAGAAGSLAPQHFGAQSSGSTGASSVPGIVDTNVNLFDWPFRKLKYRETDALIAKFKKHRVIEAWAGSFEALFHKDINGVNERLARECRDKGAGLLRPFGTVNLAWPDWEEDLRRCHESFKMPGVRIYPGYQPFDLTHPGLTRLVAATRERGLLLQIVFGMEDTRVHHPIITVGTVLATPLVAVLKAEPQARVQLLHFSGNIQGADMRALMAGTGAMIDLSRWEGNGAVGRMIGTAPGMTTARVPVDRVLFGSHAPYFPLETALLKLIESPAGAEQLHAIMQGNARRLLPRSV